MDSIAISLFLDTTYPLPALSPSSDAIETRARTALGPAFRISLMPREIHILSPRSAEYFRRTREEMLGCKLEEVGSGGKEEEAWKGVEGEMKAVGEMLVRDKEERAGKGPSMTDFFVAGSMETARVVDEAVFERMVGVKGFKEVYEGCAEWMDRRD
jgi:glutathione S-transferase